MKGFSTFTAAVMTVSVGILSGLLSRQGEHHHVTPTATIQVSLKETFKDASSRREFWKEIYSNLTQSEVTILLPKAKNKKNKNTNDDKFSLKSPRGVFDCVDVWNKNQEDHDDDATTALQCLSYGYMSVLGRNIRYLFVHSDLWTINNKKVVRGRNKKRRDEMIRLTLNTTFNSVFDRMLTHEAACKKFRRAFLKDE